MKFVLICLSCISVLSCGPNNTANSKMDKPKILVSFSILQSLISELVGDKAQVETLVPDGMDPHDWVPSAQDYKKINEAQCIILNGFGLEANFGKSIEERKKAGSIIIEFSSFIEARKMAKEELGADEHHGIDPHLWLDPLLVSRALSKVGHKIQKYIKTDLSVETQILVSKLEKLNADIAKKFDSMPESKRRFITGHESLGYFGERYKLELVGAIIPSLSSQAQVSAKDLATFKKINQEKSVAALLTELGTPPQVALALGKELGVPVKEITTHKLGDSKSYSSFIEKLANDIISASGYSE